MIGFHISRVMYAELVIIFSVNNGFRHTVRSVSGVCSILDNGAILCIKRRAGF